MISASNTFAPEISAAPLAVPAWVAATVQVCRAAWQFWAGETAAPSALTAPAAQAAAPVVRFRHPHSGQGWDGHGPQPQWLRDALLCQGYTVDELRQAARR